MLQDDGYTIKTDKQDKFLKTKVKWTLRGFQDKQEEYLQTESPASTRSGIPMSCQMTVKKGWDLFHIDLKTLFIRRKSYDMIRDMNCQSPPEANHPPYIAARLKKPVYDRNDVSQRLWNILDKTLCICEMVPTRTERYCKILLHTIA